jgi:hypothetical protein
MYDEHWKMLLLRMALAVQLLLPKAEMPARRRNGHTRSDWCNCCDWCDWCHWCNWSNKHNRHNGSNRRNQPDRGYQPDRCDQPNRGNRSIRRNWPVTSAPAFAGVHIRAHSRYVSQNSE